MSSIVKNKALYFTGSSSFKLLSDKNTLLELCNTDHLYISDNKLTSKDQTGAYWYGAKYFYRRRVPWKEI